jgi:DNA-binding NtrC family response regulator
MASGTILLIDDEARLRGLMARILGLEGYRVREAPDAKSGWAVLEREAIDVVLSDVKLPDAHGVELTKQLKARYPALEIIVLTAYGTIADGVQAMRNGAFDYLTKGDDNEKLIPVLARAFEQIGLRRQVADLQKKLGTRGRFEQVIGESPAIRQAVTLARKVAPTDTTVLLMGETGTGKEVFAQAIHAESTRSAKPFVAVNCAAFSRELLESELFGHRAGAFTGATKETKGLFEEADHGTLFLDEIGEMPLDLQAKLLRVLETGAFLKVGSAKEIHVDVRILAATNRDLKAEALAGRFRLDLFYRLSVFQIQLPALRDHPDDLPLLAEALTRQLAAKLGRRPPQLSPDFLSRLLGYDWKGNIRELRNVLERAVLLADGDTLTPADLPFDLQLSGTAETPDSLSLQDLEKQHIRRVLAQAGGNKTRAAELLGIGLTTLYAKIKEYGL